MTDLVERLRAAHPSSQQYAAGSMILAEAADEIETLRTDNATLREIFQRTWRQDNYAAIPKHTPKGTE